MESFEGSQSAKRFQAALAMLVGLAVQVTPVSALADTQLKAVMHASLRILDPIRNAGHITRNHGYMIYDVLIAQDDDYNIRPQMAEYRVSDDGLTYTFTLRDGLLFHDGQLVTAADVVASLGRWASRDVGGQLILPITDSLEAADDKTVVWKLTEPFPALLAIVSKPASIPAFIMPERIANTPGTENIDEYIGSGPFIFDQATFNPGVSVTYKKFENYNPRDEPANGLAGGKVVNVDEVQWLTMPDAQTGISALLNGEIDYLEQVPVDFVPLLANNDSIVHGPRQAAAGRPALGQIYGRMNHLQPPFDDVRIRRAAFSALSQEPFLQALIGNPEFYHTCGALFGCGTPYGSEGGTEALTRNGDPLRARSLLEEAGYDGTPVVLLQPTDVASISTHPIVAANQLRAAGFNVELQPMDWQTLLTRLVNKGPASDGGWNLFFSGWNLAEISSPLGNTTLAANGERATSGWPSDEQIEALRFAFARAETQDQRVEIAEKLQDRAIDQVIYIPLGEYGTISAHSRNLRNVQPAAVPVFWNIEKTD